MLKCWQHKILIRTRITKREVRPVSSCCKFLRVELQIPVHPSIDTSNKLFSKAITAIIQKIECILVIVANEFLV